MNKLRYSIVTLLALMTAGCYSSVTVRPAAENSSGVRYSLPATYLLVTPSATGSATYTWLYLPDTTQQYAVEANNFLTMSTLDVQTENGLLKQVGQSMDSTGVAAKAISSYATLKAAEAKSKSSSKSSDDGSSSDASTGKAKKGQAASGDDSSPQTTTTQETKTDETGKKKTTTTTTTTQQASPKTQKPISTGGIQAAYGPVLLKVVQTGNGVSLIPVGFPKLDAHGVANEIQPQEPSVQQMFATNASTRTVAFSAKNGTVNATTATISTTAAIYAFDSDFPSSGVVGMDATNATFSAKVLKFEVLGTNNVLLTFDKGLPKGNYKISFGYRQRKSDAESLGSASLLVAEPAPP